MIWDYGKTIQLISIILSYIDDCKKNKCLIKPSIVVCPSSLSLNWKNEITKFNADINVSVIRGNANERKALINEIKDHNLIITSYDLIKRDIDEYIESNIEFKYIIVDESQFIKNSNTQNAKAIKKLIGETRYALTGTPIENSLSELWSVFDFILPRISI
ncbi:MAG: SNF2-related protein [Clostridia bacterium]